MIEQDKIEFKKMMVALSALYNKPALEKDVLRIWWSLLEGYDTQIVFSAFSKFTRESQKFPTPADIVNLCKTKHDDYAQLAAPKLSKEQNRQYADNVVQAIKDQITDERKDLKAWARRIIANPANYPAIALEFAKDAINAH